jgi:hypothetical protein
MARIQMAATVYKQTGRAEPRPVECFHSARTMQQRRTSRGSSACGVAVMMLFGSQLARGATVTGANLVSQ